MAPKTDPSTTMVQYEYDGQQVNFRYERGRGCIYVSVLGNNPVTEVHFEALFDLYEKLDPQKAVLDAYKRKAESGNREIIDCLVINSDHKPILDSMFHLMH